MGLVSGQKQWFFFPPGYHFSSKTQAAWNPYEASDVWIENQLNSSRATNTQLSPYFSYGSKEEDNASHSHHNDGISSKASTRNHRDSQTEPDYGYSPIRCTQQTGDVMYVPAGWSHMTLNTHVSEPSGKSYWALPS